MSGNARAVRVTAPYMAPDAPNDGRIGLTVSFAAAATGAASLATVADAVTGFFMSSATVFGKRTLDISTCEVIDENSPAVAQSVVRF